MRKQKHKVIREYRAYTYNHTISKIAFLTLTAFMFVIDWVSIYEVFQNNELWVSAFVVLFFTILYSVYSIVSLRMYYLAFVDRILITPEGLLVEGWYQAFADWESLMYFATQKPQKKKGRATNGIHTRKAVIGSKSSVWFKYDFTTNFIPISHICPIETRFRWTKLAFELDLDKFAETPLGQDLLHYSPQLFEEMQNGKS